MLFITGIVLSSIIKFLLGYLGHTISNNLNHEFNLKIFKSLIHAKTILDQKVDENILNSEETVFKVKTEDGNLNFYFGDLNTHAGKFTFQHDVQGTLNHTWAWPVAQTLAILNLDGDKKISITDQGAMQISVDSGMAKYDYILPAQSK